MANRTLMNIELRRFKSMPRTLWLVLIAGLAFLLANILTLLSLSGLKIDPGTATLFGAVIGLCVVAWQTNKGFGNLIRSQENGARLERQARLHKAELEEDAKKKQDEREMRLLRSAIRAEVAAIYAKVLQQSDLARQSYTISRMLDKHGAVSTTKEYKTPTIDAPVFKSNLDRIGLLGSDLGADVIKTLSKADGVSHSAAFDAPIPNHILASLAAARFSYLQKWASDLFHVAMRIRAVEEGTVDPGQLISSESARYAKIEELDKDA